MSCFRAKWVLSLLPFVLYIKRTVILPPGLHRDDTILEDGDVREALRRLPEDQYNDRVFRIKRALDLSMKQQLLPKEMWTKFEEVCQNINSLSVRMYLQVDVYLPVKHN